MRQNELTDAKGLAALLKVSKRSIFRYASSGRIPAAVRIGGSLRWRMQEDVLPWIALGCPDRKTFEARKEAENAK